MRCCRWAHEPRRGRVLLVAVAWICSTVASAFEFYPPFLPDHVAANETITHVELRLYLAGNETENQVRVIPVSNSILFTPSELVFSSASPVASMMTMVARKTGSQEIKFIARIERVENGSVEVVQDSSEIAVATVDVLPTPLSFSIDDPQWHGVILVNDSFDETVFGVNTSSLWGQIDHGYPSTACGAFDGVKALYFTALGDRSATTKPLSLLGFDGKIHFHQLYGYRSGQDYDGTGDNRISCEQVDKGEEVVLSYLPVNQSESNASAWIPLQEDPLLSPGDKSFAPYSVILPRAAMHSNARFRWQQKTHSSFPVDPVPGLTIKALLAGENDNTSVSGGLGVNERELWQVRNLFDQWALDDVRLEVRLNPPVFQYIGDNSSEIITVSTIAGDVNMSVDHAIVLVDSPVVNTWTEYAVGDGTHPFPTCDIANAVSANTVQTVRLDQSGYIHAVACLDVHGDASVVVSSFPTRSQRILVKARPPLVTTTVDTTTSVDAWTVRLQCTGCAFMRYTAFSAPTYNIWEDVLSDDVVSHIAPSCSYGNLVNGSDGSFQLSSNNRIFAIACGRSLIPSDITQSSALNVAPRAPTFQFTYTPTTVTNEFVVTISPPTGSVLGVVYTIGDSNTVDPSCPLPENARTGSAIVTVRASDVIRAMSCCVKVHCVESDIAVWGPIQVRAVTPIFSMGCSNMKPLTMMVHVSPITLNAWIQYQIGKPSNPLDCVETDRSPFTSSGEIEVAMQSTSVFAVSCLSGLLPSDLVEIPVDVGQCCAGIQSYLYPSCAHVLLLHDDFKSCLDSSKWTTITSQWGGDDVNGGVHADNVHCILGDAHVKPLLQLSAHGDLFPGTTPVGNKWVDSDGSLQPRTFDDMYLEWALDGVSPTPCNDPSRCPARRVGAAIQTTMLKENAGVMVVRLKPCEKFGTLTQIWWGDYTSREDETLQEVPFLPLWKAGMYQAKTTSQVSFVVSSPSLLPLDDDTVVVDGFIEVAMQWNATLGRSNLYVNGELVHKQSGVQSGPANEPLSIGVWFPNAVAGEPLFDSCDVLVDEVSVYKAEITGDRWCDYENVNQSAITCVTNADCEDWVFQNCFMPIHEALCIDHRIETIRQANATTNLDGSEEVTTDEVDTTDSESNDSAQEVPQWFCQFRLQPIVSQSDPTGSLSSTTEMSERVVQLQWPTEEGPTDIDEPESAVDEEF